MEHFVVPKPSRFAKARLALPLLACAWLASCANLVGPHDVEVPLTRLQASLERRFPINNRMMSLLDIQLTHPQLAILPENDRVALSMDVSVAPPFIKQSWSGNLALSGHLVIDPSRNAVLIRDARVDRVAIDGSDEARQRQFATLGSLIAEKITRDQPLYSLRADELRFAGVQFVPTKIKTTPTSLVVTLEPVK